MESGFLGLRTCRIEFNVPLAREATHEREHVFWSKFEVSIILYDTFTFTCLLTIVKAWLKHMMLLKEGH